MDSALRRTPTCVRSGAIRPPAPFSLWQPRQPAALMIAVGSVLPPANAAPAGLPPALAGLAPGAGWLCCGMSDAVTSTVPPCDSKNAISAQICGGESCFVITGMIGWEAAPTKAGGVGWGSERGFFLGLPGPGLPPGAAGGPGRLLPVGGVGGVVA